MEGRKKPFSEFERLLLIKLIQQNSAIIGNKKTDSTSLAKKNAVWQRIAEEYNKSPRISRKVNVKQLKKFWNNLKMRWRYTKMQENKKKNIGGPVLSDMDPERATPHLLPVIKVINCDLVQSQQDDNDSQYWVHVKTKEEELQIEPSPTELPNSLPALSPVNTETPEHPKLPCSTSNKCHCLQSTDYINVELGKTKIQEQHYKNLQIKFELEMQHLKKTQEIELKLKERELTHKLMMYELYEEEMKLKLEKLKKNNYFKFNVIK